MGTSQPGSRGVAGAAGPAGFGTVTPTVPARALNTPWTPHATKAVLVVATVEIRCSAALIAGQAGTVTLVSDPGAPVTDRCSLKNSLIPGLITALGDSTIQRGPLVFLVPPTWQVSLVTSIQAGAPVFSLINVSEMVLG